MIKEVFVQLGLTKFIIARCNRKTRAITLSYVGGKPASMTDSSCLRREEVIENAFKTFAGLGAPVSLEYDPVSSKGISRITRTR